MTELAPRITVDEQVAFGKPVIQGTRVPVALVVGKLAGRMSLSAIAAEYELEMTDILAVLSHAAPLCNE